MQITDIFGNTIEVTDLKKAIQQTESFVEFSKNQTILFQEYFFTNKIDAHGRQIRLTSTPKKAKTVTNLAFYEHQLNQLKKLESCKTVE